MDLFFRYFSNTILRRGIIYKVPCLAVSVKLIMELFMLSNVLLHNVLVHLFNKCILSVCSQ